MSVDDLRSQTKESDQETPSHTHYIVKEVASDAIALSVQEHFNRTGRLEIPSLNIVATNDDANDIKWLR